VLLRAEWVVPISRPPVRDGAVLVEGSTITAVGPYEEVRRLAGRGCDFRDFGRAIIMPGLVNAHTHLMLTVLRGIEDDLTLFPWLASGVLGPEELLDERDFYYSALLGCLEAVRSGTTCLADACTRDVGLRAMAEAGLRGTAYLEVFELGTSPEEAVEKGLRAVARMAREAPERVRAGISPHSPYANSRETVELLTERAREEGLPICLHLAETKAELEFFLEGTGELGLVARELGLRARGGLGKTPTQYLHELGLLGADVLLAHAVHLTDEDITLIAEAGSPVAHCPKSNAKLGSGVARVPEMLASGVKVSLGTDSAASNNKLDMFEEMRAAVLVQRATRADAPVLTADDVLRMATLGGAEALGLGNSVGSLEPGKKADIIVVGLHEGLVPVYNPISTLVYCASGSDVVFTMVDGEVLYERGRFYGLDAERILSTCRDIEEKLAEGL